LAFYAIDCHIVAVLEFIERNICS